MVYFSILLIVIFGLVSRQFYGLVTFFCLGLGFFYDPVFIQDINWLKTITVVSKH